MFKIKPDRTYTFKHEDEDCSFTVTFKFPYTEDMGLSKLAKFAEPTNDNPKEMLTLLREMLIGCTDICNEDTNELIEITKRNADGATYIDEVNQKAVFNEVVRFPQLFMSIMSAYVGPKGKNLLSGAMQQLTGNGQ